MEHSWYVEYLIRNALSIRERCETFFVAQLFEPAYSIDFEDDLYTDLLVVERLVKQMSLNKLLTKKQRLLIYYLSKGYNLTDLERMSGVSRITLSKIFSDLCGAIAFRLGGQFTDVGFIEYMIDKYSLTTSQITKLQSFLESNKRHTSGGVHDNQVTN